MGTSLAGLLIVSVFVTSAITMWRVELMGIVLFADARKAATELEGEQARTKIDLITAGADPGTSILTVDVRNTGTISVSESDFPRMDVIVHYNGGVRASEAFTYTTSDPPGLGQWTDTSTSGQFETAIWNPDEILSVDIALGTPCDSGTVVIGTPNGINDTKSYLCSTAPPPITGNNWYLHSETSSISGTVYNDLKYNVSGDDPATTISAVFTAGQTGRVRASTGKFVYPLTGVTQLPVADWNVTYRVKRSTPDSGFYWFTSANDISLTTTGSWQDIDISSNVPAGTTGAVVEVVNTGSTSNNSGVVRGKEDTNDYMSSPAFEEIQSQTHRYQIVKVDSNRVIQGYIEDTAIDFKLLGYTIGLDPSYFTTPIDISPPSTGSWTTVDLVTYVDSDADGVILFIDSVDNVDRDFGIREVGDGFSFVSAEHLLDEYGNTMYVVGLSPSKHFEAFVATTDVKIYLVGQTKGSITYYNLDVAVADPTTGSWTPTPQQLDADDYGILPRANGLFFHVTNQQASKRLSFRHGDSTDDWNGATGTTKQAMMAAVALDGGNQWDEYMEADDAAVFIAAYSRLVEMVVHVDMDVIIRKSDGTIRTTLATDVADSSNITSKEWQTFSGTYAFPGYTVVSGTDYLEIDLFADATLNSSQENVSVDFRIDDPGLPISSQTRVLEVLS